MPASLFRLRTALLLLLLGTPLTARPGLAATEQEWAAFRADVSAKCLAAAEPLFETATAVVDPFGSERFGLALIEGKARGAAVTIRAICVYDKVAKTAEIGGELPSAADTAPGRAVLPLAAILDPCGAACEAAVARLAPADVAGLAALPDRVAATIAAVEAAPGIRLDADAASALARLRAADPSVPPAIRPGEHACTVFWFGFLDNGGERVGRHRCTVEDRDGRLVLAKVSGDRLAADLVPTDGGARLLVGRTFLPEHSARTYDVALPANPENPNFGNTVGIALADGAGLIVVSADMRGFTEPDATFFELLVVE